MRVLPREAIVDGVSEHAERLLEIDPFGPTSLMPRGTRDSALRKTIEGRIGRERAKHGLRLDEAFRDVLDLGQREIEQPILIEERSTVAAADNLEWIGFRLAERGRKCSSGALGQLRSFAINDNIDRVGVLRKGRVELTFALTPIEIRRDQLTGVGRDREVVDNVVNRARRNDEAEQNREP